MVAVLHDYENMKSDPGIQDFGGKTNHRNVWTEEETS
jgi:hypothetical protein